MRKTNKKAGFTLVEIMIVVLIIGILMAIAVPNFVKARNTSRGNSCVANLKQIDSAKEQWAMDNKKDTGATVLLTDIYPTYMKVNPVCNSGDGHIRGGQPQEEQMYAVTKASPPNDLLAVGPSSQCRLKGKSCPSLYQSIHTLQHQFRGAGILAFGGKRRKSGSNHVGVQEFCTLDVLRQEPIGERGLASTIRSGNYVNGRIAR